MTTLFADDFNRADNATVDATNWTENGGSDWSIVSNRVRAANSAIFLITTTSAHAAVADCYVEVEIRDNTGLDGGPMSRALSNGTQGYFADIIAASNLMNFWRRVAGSDTQVGADITGLTFAIGDKIGLLTQTVGATVELSLYQNSVFKGKVVDSTGARLLSAGQTGIAHFLPAPCDYDNFLVTDLASSTFPPVPESLVLKSQLAAMLAR
jgi:hypothetical protein